MLSRLLHRLPAKPQRRPLKQQRRRPITVRRQQQQLTSQLSRLLPEKPPAVTIISCLRWLEWNGMRSHAGKNTPWSAHREGKQGNNSGHSMLWEGTLENGGKSGLGNGTRSAYVRRCHEAGHPACCAPGGCRRRYCCCLHVFQKGSRLATVLKKRATLAGGALQRQQETQVSAGALFVLGSSPPAPGSWVPPAALRPPSPPARTHLPEQPAHLDDGGEVPPDLGASAGQRCAPLHRQLRQELGQLHVVHQVEHALHTGPPVGRGPSDRHVSSRCHASNQHRWRRSHCQSRWQAAWQHPTPHPTPRRRSRKSEGRHLP